MRLVKSHLVFIFFILVNTGLASAQSAGTTETVEMPKPEKPIRIGAGLGYSFIGYREETDLPLNRYLDTFTFNLNGNIEKNKFYFLSNLGFLTGKVDSIEIKKDDDYFTYYQRESVFFRLYFENALDYQKWGSSVFPGYIGCALRGDLYYAAFPESYYYSLTVLCSLNLHLIQKWILNEKKEFVLSASIPFFGYAIRPPYYGLLYTPLDSEERITSFHNYRAIFGDIKYYQKLNNYFSFYLGLGFELSHITFPQPRRDASFGMNAGIVFSF